MFDGDAVYVGLLFMFSCPMQGDHLRICREPVPHPSYETGAGPPPHLPSSPPPAPFVGSIARRDEEGGLPRPVQPAGTRTMAAGRWRCCWCRCWRRCWRSPRGTPPRDGWAPRGTDRSLPGGGTARAARRREGAGGARGAGGAGGGRPPAGPGSFRWGWTTRAGSSCPARTAAARRGWCEDCGRCLPGGEAGPQEHSCSVWGLTCPAPAASPRSGPGRYKTEAAEREAAVEAYSAVYRQYEGLQREVASLASSLSVARSRKADADRVVAAHRVSWPRRRPTWPRGRRPRREEREPRARSRSLTRASRAGRSRATRPARPRPPRRSRWPGSAGRRVCVVRRGAVQV